MTSRVAGAPARLPCALGWSETSLMSFAPEGLDEAGAQHKCRADRVLR